MVLHRSDLYEGKKRKPQSKYAEAGTPAQASGAIVRNPAAEPQGGKPPFLTRGTATAPQPLTTTAPTPPEDEAARKAAAEAALKAAAEAAAGGGTGGETANETAGKPQA